MKRIGYSILIGAGCALLFWGISKLQPNKRKNKASLINVFKKRSSHNETYYSAQLRVAIGSPENDSELIEQTKQQILYRLRGSYTSLSLERFDKNVYTLKANKILDTAVFKTAITGTGKIEFSELFSLTEISESLNSADSQLRNEADLLEKQKKLKEVKRDLDTVTDKLSVVLDHTGLEQSAVDLGLRKFISFSSPYQNVDGSVIGPAELGYVKTKDTSALNKVLNDPEIITHFPENLKFVYGYLDIDLYSDDSMLKLFAKKDLDKAFFPFPTGDQITEATPEIEPSTGQSIIAFTFNSQGAQDWYLMTSRNSNKPIAIITNNVVLAAPVVEQAIEGGQSKILGNFSYDETAQLCKMILARELPLSTTIIAASFEYHNAKKFGLALIILILFVLSSAASYGISFLLKPASKP